MPYKAYGDNVYHLVNCWGLYTADAHVRLKYSDLLGEGDLLEEAMEKAMVFAVNSQAYIRFRVYDESADYVFSPSGFFYKNDNAFTANELMARIDEMIQDNFAELVVTAREYPYSLVKLFSKLREEYNIPIVNGLNLMGDETHIRYRIKELRNLSWDMEDDDRPLYDGLKAQYEKLPERQLWDSFEEKLNMEKRNKSILGL